jgi:hypothetical protein
MVALCAAPFFPLSHVLDQAFSDITVNFVAPQEGIGQQPMPRLKFSVQLTLITPKCQAESPPRAHGEKAYAMDSWKAWEEACLVSEYNRQEESTKVTTVVAVACDSMERVGLLERKTGEEGPRDSIHDSRITMRWLHYAVSFSRSWDGSLVWSS